MERNAGEEDDNILKCNLLYKNLVYVLRKTIDNFVSVSAKSELTANHENFSKFFLFSTKSFPIIRPSQPSVRRNLHLLNRRLRLESITDHCLESNVEVKSVWSYTSNIPYVFLSWLLIWMTDFSYTSVGYSRFIGVKNILVDFRITYFRRHYVTSSHHNI